MNALENAPKRNSGGQKLTQHFPSGIICAQIKNNDDPSFTVMDVSRIRLTFDYSDLLKFDACMQLEDVLLFVSRSGASTPRNRREAASRCRCTAERSTQAQGRQRWRQGIPFQICVFLRTKHPIFPVREPKPKKVCTDRESNPGLYRGRVLFYH